MKKLICLFALFAICSTSNAATLVHNSGIVLLNNYYGLLFDRLDLLNEKKFKTPADQLKAVQYLQFLATGLETGAADDSLLALNKILCGLPLTTAVTDNLKATPEQKKIITDMLNASISHWPAIGLTSIEAFRGNWLIRDGLLIEKADRWEFTVTKRAYDVLLAKSPYSFSTIKLPWMPKPLHVTW